ncbi:MAG: CYCXC family (seleno)protein [Pyrinomonadaceae bacterium]
MKNRFLFLAIGLLALAAGALVIMRTKDDSGPSAPGSTVFAPSASPSEPAHSPAVTVAGVPAYQSPTEAQHLAPTLAPAQFFGKARIAYQIVKEIPQTIAQLPCYCHCDESFGHKSLHTCFVDDHAAHCAVCVDEALLAYKLEKQDKLTPEQVRKVIIEKYSSAHADH